MSSVTALVTFSGTILFSKVRSSSGGRSLKGMGMVVPKNNYMLTFV